MENHTALVRTWQDRHNVQPDFVGHVCKGVLYWIATGPLYGVDGGEAILKKSQADKNDNRNTHDFCIATIKSFPSYYHYKYCAGVKMQVEMAESNDG